ncbi:hypothetical protein [Lunatibacter salilacus]|uniref:hypothetical protein n=1 Tax=Lunatibacter salilacus TaxID=2483804 RepID=UPI00131C7D31|nr:hypothetical protein [Lunatibacter salilacus]
MLKGFFHFILPCFLALFLFSCEPIEEPAVREQWKMVQGFHEGLTHAQEINGKLYAASKTRIYGQATLQGPNTFNQLSQIMPSEFQFRLPLSEKLMATFKEQDLYLMPAGNQESLLVLPMIELDPDFRNFQYIYLTPGGEQISIDTKGNVLVPYNSSKDGRRKYTPDFLWLKTGIIEGEVKILEQKLIKEEYFDEFVSIWFLKVFDNFTRVTIGYKTFDIDLNGNIELRFDHLTKSVQVGNEIITFAIEGLRFRNYPLLVYKSDILGKNNELIGTYDLSQFSHSHSSLLGSVFHNIYNINGIIVVAGGDSIYRLAMDDQAIAFTELDNLGLEDTNITSISLINNSTVFVTSFEATGQKNWGGFSKSLENFFTEK